MTATRIGTILFTGPDECLLLVDQLLAQLAHEILKRRAVARRSPRTFKGLEVVRYSAG